MIGIGKSWIVNRMIEFSTHFPDIQLNVTMDFPDKILYGFERRQFDCLVLPESLCPHYSEHKILHNEKATLVFPNSPKFKITEETSLKELLDFPQRTCPRLLICRCRLMASTQRGISGPMAPNTLPRLT